MSDARDEGELEVAPARPRLVGVAEVLAVVGVAAVSVGLHQIYPPAAPIFAGLVMLAAAVARANRG